MGDVRPYPKIGAIRDPAVRYAQIQPYEKVETNIDAITVLVVILKHLNLRVKILDVVHMKQIFRSAGN